MNTRNTLGAVLLWLALSLTATAQTLRVEHCNTGTEPLPGVVDVTVPNALVSDLQVWTGKSETAGPIVAVRGPSRGSKARGYTVLHLLTTSGYWPAGAGDVELEPSPDARVDSANFRPHPWVTQPARFAPTIKVLGVPIALGLTGFDSDALTQSLHLAGTTVSGPPVHARLRIRAEYGSPILEVDGLIAYSDFGPDRAMAIDLEASDVEIEFGAGEVRWDHAFEQGFEANGGARMHAAAGYPFSCRIIGRPAVVADEHTDPEAAPMPIGELEQVAPADPWPDGVGELVARLDPWQWQGHVGPLGAITVNPTWKLPPKPRNLDAPPTTGGRAAFGSLAGIEAFSTDVRGLPRLRAGIREEILRPVFHLESGSLWSASGHPNVAVYNGQPDSRFGSDLLSFGGTTAPRPTLRLQDEAHLALGYPFVCALLLDDWHARQYLEAELRLRLASLPWYTTSPRAVGRMLMGLAQIHCVIDEPSDDARRTQIEEFVREKAGAVSARVHSAMQFVALDDVFPGYVDDRIDVVRRFVSEATHSWVPYQQALLSNGVAQWQVLKQSVIENLPIWEQTIRMCRTVVSYGFVNVQMPSTLGRPGTVSVHHPIYTSAWVAPNGAPLRLSDPVVYEDVQKRTLDLATSVGLFRAQMAMCAAIVARMDPEVPADVQAKAINVLNLAPITGLDAARYLGAYLSGE